MVIIRDILKPVFFTVFTQFVYVVYKYYEYFLGQKPFVNRNKGLSLDKEYYSYHLIVLPKRAPSKMHFGRDYGRKKLKKPAW